MSKHVYIIGGGPSLIGFDFDALPDGPRIGANRSAWLANCDMFCTVDKNIHIREADNIRAFGVNAHVATTNDNGLYPKTTYWQYARTLEGLALTPNTLAGSNSGFAALNLAVQLGYTEIALLGFDFKWDGGRCHFHEGYGQKRHVERQLMGWAHAFDYAARQTRELGINVTNFVGPLGSNLKAYPSVPLQELL